MRREGTPRVLPPFGPDGCGCGAASTLLPDRDCACACSSDLLAVLALPPSVLEECVGGGGRLRLVLLCGRGLLPGCPLPLQTHESGAPVRSARATAGRERRRARRSSARAVSSSTRSPPRNSNGHEFGRRRPTRWRCLTRAFGTARRR